jgi:hypothetical protein
MGQRNSVERYDNGSVLLLQRGPRPIIPEDPVVAALRRSGGDMTTTIPPFSRSDLEVSRDGRWPSIAYIDAFDPGESVHDSKAINKGSSKPENFTRQPMYTRYGVKY